MFYIILDKYLLKIDIQIKCLQFFFKYYVKLNK